MGLLVLFGLLLDITDLLRNLLQRIFVRTVLHLEVWPGGGEKKSEGTELGEGSRRGSPTLLPLCGRCLSRHDGQRLNGRTPNSRPM